LKDDERSDAGCQLIKIYSPDEISKRLGGISVKSLTELIRNSGLETTTLGYSEPSRKGGRRRRVWGMTEPQLEALLALRRRRGLGRDST
jgi:hypothetical protein